MSFWNEFSAALSGLVTKAEAEIKAAEQYLAPLVVAGAQEVAASALAAVLQQAPLVISGSEKLSAATSAVVTNLAATGKSVAVNIAETAVQAAYNQIAPVAAHPDAVPASAHG